MIPVDHSTGFAPADITDGRPEGYWTSRYPSRAWWIIACEAIYLFLLLFGTPALLLWVCSSAPVREFGFDQGSYHGALPWICAWLGGTLGGTLFAVKWLYHSVAKQIWNLDRILWRFFTPHLSGGLAFGTILLITSGVVRIFDASIAATPRVTIGIAFLVGYFSDMAVAKLTEVAKTLFGQSKDSALDVEPRQGGNREKTVTAVRPDAGGPFKAP